MADQQKEISKSKLKRLNRKARADKVDQKLSVEKRGRKNAENLAQNWRKKAMNYKM